MEHTEVILVDASDNATGTMEKLQAHQEGLLHRAFSIFIFNSAGEMLLQQRALSKYHSGGLWTNACCSHPLPGECTTGAAHRRLKEELGFEATLHKIFDFVYKAAMENGLTEHEFDHVFAGEYEGEIDFNRDEVMDYCYKRMSEIRQDLEIYPQQYTAWFHIAFPRIESWWNKEYKTKLV
jgi:isopentenyl-diphosphate Delta-isomerase